MNLVWLWFHFVAHFLQSGVREVLGEGDTTQKCCEIIGNHQEFTTLVIQENKIENHDDGSKSKIAFAMFASKKTMSYASYTILINSYYCRMKNYDFKLFTEDNTPFSFDADKRWNKVGIVVDAIGNKENKGDNWNGWGKHLEYLVVIDADLIVTDFSLDIESITSSYPNAHLLMSQDAADIANSGFLIVKNSKWSINFFSKWWESRFSSPTDQHAFNALYRDQQQEDASTPPGNHHIALLPPNEINSEYPVYQTFTPSSRVLHLFGEIDEIRAEVFKYAASELCRFSVTTSSSTSNKKRRGPKKYPPQLGLTSAKLREIAVEQISSRRSEIKSKLTACFKESCPEEIIVPLLEGLQREVSSLCGYGRGILVEENSNECLSLALDNFNLVKSLVAGLERDQDPSKLGEGIDVGAKIPITYLDHLAQNLYSAFSWSEDSLETIEKGEQVARLQNRMIKSGQVASLAPLIYRQSVMLAELSRMCDRLFQQAEITPPSLSSPTPSYLSFLKNGALTFARSSLQWIQSIGTQPGQRDYETYVQGMIHSHLLLAKLLITNATTAQSSSATLAETDEEGNLNTGQGKGDGQGKGEGELVEGLDLVLAGLKLSERFFGESEKRKSDDFKIARDLLSSSCHEAEEIFEMIQRSEGAVGGGGGGGEVAKSFQLYQLICNNNDNNDRNRGRS